MLGRERLELGDELSVPAEPELGLDALLDRSDAQLLRAGRSRRCANGSSANSASGGPAPELERRRAASAPPRPSSPAPSAGVLREQPLEAQRRRRCPASTLEHVAGRARRQRGERCPRRRAPCAAARCARVARRARSAAARRPRPPRAGGPPATISPARRSRLASSARCSRPAERQPASPVVDLQWSEYAELHGPPVDASTRSRARYRGVTAWMDSCGGVVGVETKATFGKGERDGSADWRHGAGLRGGDHAKAGSASTTGSATPGACCSRTRRTSPRSARPSSATWPRSSPTSTSGTSR